MTANFPRKIACGKIPFLFFAFLVFLSLCACEFENPWMKEVLQEKTITFNTNGGSSVPSQKLYAGQRVTRPSNPYKTNSVFLGWYKDNATFLQLYDFSYVPQRDMTLYAKWDGGTGSETTITVIDSVNVTVSNPSTGYDQTASASGGTGYTCGIVTWTPTVDKFMGNTIYSAEVTLTANSGYNFTPNTTASINGHEAEIEYIDETKVTVSHTFAPTTAAMITNITIASQPTKMVYAHGDSLNLAGLAVTLTYADASTEDVQYSESNFESNNISINLQNGAILSRSEHNDKYVEVSISPSIKANTQSKLTINRATPTAGDFTISEIREFTYDGSSKTVTVTANSGKTGMGSVTVKYGNSTTAPINAGTYTVTFDVAEGTNYTSASGLNAGTLEIKKATPTADDFTISNLTQTTDSITPVTITPKTGKSNGSITIYYNNVSLSPPTSTTILPSTGGSYPVTFNVEASGDGNWNAANNLEAGTLIIELIFSDVSAFATHLASLPTNSENTPHNIKLNISNTADFTAIKTALISSTNSNKYIILDLSKSTILTIPNYAFESCFFLTSIIIPNSVTTIGNGAFNACFSLTSVNIPDSVTTIGNRAFNSCTSLTSVNIPNGVTTIGEWTFADCGSLTNITIPNSVTAIGDIAFGAPITGVSSLTSITIPNSVTTIGIGAFTECSSLTSVTFEGTITSDNFSPDYPFLGDLRDKYFANPGGGIGTYTRSGTGGTDPYIWTKQP